MKMKSKRWWVATIAVVLMLMVASALVLLHTPPVKRYVLDRVREYFRSSQGIELEVAVLDYNLFRLSLQLEQVTLKSAAAPDLPPLLKIDRTYINLPLRHLLRGLFALHEARLEGVALHVVLDQGGRNNLPKPPTAGPELPQQASKGEPSYLISSLKIKDGSAVFEDRQHDLQVELPLWKLEMRGILETLEHHIRFQTEEVGSAIYQKRPLPLRNLEFDAVLKRAGLDLKNFKLNADGSQIMITGALEDFSKPVMNVTVNTDLDLRQTTQFADLREKIEGKLKGQAILNVSQNRIQISSQLEGSDIAAAGYDPIDLSARSKWDSDSQIVQLEAFSARSRAGTVEGQANLDVSEKGGKSWLQAQIDDLDLERISRPLHLPIRLASRAKGTVNAEWQGLEFAKANGDLRMQLDATRPRPARDILPLSASLSLTSSNNRILLSITSARCLSSRLQGRIFLHSLKNLGGEVYGEVESLAALLSDLDAFLGRKEEGPLIGVQLDGVANLAATVGGTVDRPALSASVNAPAAEVGELRDVALRATGEFNPDRLLLQDAEVSWQGQSLYAQGEVGLRGRSPSLNMSAQIREASVSTIMAVLNKEVPAAGMLRANATLGGTLEKPQAGVTLSASDLMVYGEPMGNFLAEAQLANQKLEVTKVRLDKPLPSGEVGTLEAKATYDLDSRVYDLQVEGKDLKFSTLTLPGDVPVSGELNLSARGTGALDDPSMKVKLDLDNLYVRNRTYGSIGATASLEEQRAILEVRAPQFNLSSRARIQTKFPYPAEIEVDANNTDLSKLDIQMAKDRRLAGTLSATLKGSGDLNEWKKGEASARISHLQVTVDEHEIRNQGPLEVGYRNGTLGVPSAILVSGNTHLQIEGTLPLEQTTSPGFLRVKGHSDLGTVLAFVPTNSEQYASGELNLDLSLEGNLQRIVPSLEFSLTNGFFYSPSVLTPFTNIEVDLLVKDGSLILNKAATQWALGDIQATGELPLALLPASLPFQLERNEGPARFTLDIKDLQPDSIPALPREVSGVLSLHVEGQAPRLDLNAFTVKATFDQLRLKLAEFEIQQSETSTISLQNSVARVDQFTLTGPSTRFEVVGSAGLTGDRPLDLRLNGDLDAAILTIILEEFRARGETRFQLALGGRLNAPELSGFLEMQEGQASLESPRIAAESLNVRLNLGRDRLAIERFTGSLNGGSLNVNGGIGYAGTELKDINVDVALSDVYLNFPEGLKTASETDLRIRSQGDFIVIRGEVRILEGSYTDPLEIETQILRKLRSGESLELVKEPSPFLSRIRYDISVNTQGPVAVDNNLAKLALYANLRVVGTYYRPALTGRMALEEGGLIYFSERKYYVERGIIDFVSETKIEPSLDILAKTKAGIYDIDLHLSGTPKDLSSTLTSDPPLPEPDIVSVLLTGKTLEEFRGKEIDVAKEQVLSYVTGRLGSRISRGAEQTLGLSQVRIEPNLIANESDPGARLTLGQNITKDLSLIYSMNLADGQDQIWVAEYDFTKRFKTRGIKQSDNSYRYEFQHDLRFGGPPGAGRISDSQFRSRPPKEIGRIQFLGDTGFSEKQLADKLKAKPGDRYDFFKVRKGIDRLNNFYARQGRLEADIRLNREVPDSYVNLLFNIHAGPEVRFVFEGSKVSGDVEKKVRQIWKEGIFDGQRAEESIRAIREPLLEQGYIQSKVEYDIENPSEGSKRVIFRIDPGVRYEDIELVFEGVSAIPSSQLEERVKKAKLTTEVHIRPKKVTDFLTRLYHQQGYLNAEVRPPRYELDPQTRAARVIIPVQEGPRFKIGDLQFKGNSAFTNNQLQQALLFSTDQPYDPQLLQNSLPRLEELYWRNGYNDVVINYTLKRRPETDVLDIFFDITENKQGIVQEVRIEGNDQTSDRFVRGQIELSSGDVLDLEKINRARGSLYHTGAYSLVDIRTEPVENAEANLDEAKKPVRILVHLRELKPYELRYGGLYDTERGPGISAAFTSRNLLGSARLLGGSTRYDSQLQEVRGYFSQPFVRGLRLKSNATTFLRRESLLDKTFIVDRLGFSFIQEARLKNSFVFSYGYRYERARSFEKEPANPLVPLNTRLNTSRLLGTLTRETRDDPLDATRGSFSSTALEFSPQMLGSGLGFIKYYGQYFKYVPLAEPVEIPYQKGLKRSRLVYAGSLRVGLAKGLGGLEIIGIERFRSERFFAGGGTTLRGFQQDRVGPTEERLVRDRKTGVLERKQVPTGGEAVFILNNEIRFPLFHIFDGVGFVDLGNVYAKVADFNPFNIRKSAGVGLRVRTPLFLIRADFGAKLDRKPGESLGSFFFSIGQAF